MKFRHAVILLTNGCRRGRLACDQSPRRSKPTTATSSWLVRMQMGQMVRAPASTYIRIIDHQRSRLQLRTLVSRLARLETGPRRPASQGHGPSLQLSALACVTPSASKCACRMACTMRVMRPLRPPQQRDSWPHAVASSYTSGATAPAWLPPPHRIKAEQLARPSTAPHSCGPTRSATTTAQSTILIITR